MKTKIIEKQKEYIKKVKEINKNKELKYYILTMGCKLNENDSEKLIGMVEEMGYKQSNNLNDANLYLINTCCVRENAEEKVFGKLRGIKKDKRKKRYNYCNWWMYDARRTYNRKDKKKLPICGYYIWYTYSSQSTRRYI